MKLLKIHNVLILATLLIWAGCTDDSTGDLGEKPVAEFTSSDNDMSVEVGQIVTFTDASSNNPYLYTWSIEGGSPTYSNQKSVEVEFISEGSQAVTLTVRNDAGADEITKYINITPLVIPDLETTPLIKMRFESNLANEGSAGGEGVIEGAANYEPRSKYGGMALVFSGEPMDVELPHFTGVNGANPRSTACWVKTSMSGANGGIITWGASGTLSRHSFKINTAGNLRMEWQGGGFNSTGIINDDNWHHVAMTYDGSTVRLYIDGVEDGVLEGVTLNTSVAGEIAVAIGSMQTYYHFFTGLIDDARIYDTALTPEQVKFLSEIH